MNLRRNIIVVFMCLMMVPFVVGQVNRQMGVIKGTITEADGTPVPGATVTAKSPALIGEISSITTVSGDYRLVGLPPGVYELTVALTGFQTVRRPDIKVGTGQTYTVDLVTEVSTLQEEITVTGTPPVVDLQSNKISNVVSTELLQSLPISRDVTRVFGITAGTVSDPAGPYSGSVHGANTGSTAYELDGVNGESPTTGGMQNRPQFESVEEVEVVTGGLPAQVGATGGSFISVVTKSGGNQFHGQAQAYYTAKGLNQMLFTDEELAAYGASKPAFAEYDYSASFSLGGPIIRDKIWFYGTMEYSKNEYTLTFVPVTLDGKTYQPYNNPTKTIAPFFKLTTQLNKNMRLFVMFNGSYRKNFYGAGYYRTEDATNDSNYNLTAANAELNWTLGPNTFVNVRGGFNNLYWELISKEGARDQVSKTDSYSGYTWGNLPGEEQYTTRRGENASIRLTHFMDDVLGGNHEIGAGVEWVRSFDRLTVARGNPLTMRYWRGNKYYYQGRGYDRAAYGDGLIGLAIQGVNEGDSTKDLIGKRISGYLQDAFTTMKNRLTINLGVRFDWYGGGFGGGTTTGTPTNGLAYNVGQWVAENIGWNPYAAMSWDEIKNSMNFTSLSPRLGISYDLFGDGKTAVKVSFGRYYEAMPVMWFCMAQAGIQASYNYNWWDENGNGVPDFVGIDRYEPTDGWWQFSEQDVDILAQQVAGKGDKYALKAPYNNEIIVSLSHELATNFSVKGQYIYKQVYRDHSAGYFNIATQEYLISLQDSPDGFWLPYTCTIPAYSSEFPAKEVTVYIPTEGEYWDDVYWKQFSTPYSKRIYNGFEISADKRYSNGWALGGSVTISSSKSTLDTEWGQLDPNTVDLYGYDPLDNPLIITLYGTFKLPLAFVGSFIYRHEEGYPLDNYAYVHVPDSWILENGGATWWNNIYVRLDELGTRRSPSYDNVDLRLEKEFKFGFGTVSVFADVFNLLGRKVVSVGQVPGGTWYSDAYGTDQGTRETEWNYGIVSSVTGVRTYKVSARITF